MTNPCSSPQRDTPSPGERFTDPTTTVVWAAIAALPAAAKHEVFERLGVLLACGPTRSPQQTREHRAVAALREAHAMFPAADGEGPLTVETFRALRSQHPQNQWPPDGSLRTWLGGGWNDALRRAALEAHPDGDVVHVGFGQRDYSEDDVVCAVQLCAEMLCEVPTFRSRIRGVLLRSDKRISP